jgi:hypothetical protein
VTREDVAGWLERYVEAWRSYNREQIGDLFSEDAEYSFYPYEEPRRGREAIVDGWFEGKDEPGTWEAEYAPVVIDGQLAVATGRSSYRDEPQGEVKRVYFNCFLMRFDDDGRCSEFTEWFMQQPEA